MATSFGHDLLVSVKNTIGQADGVVEVWVRCWENELSKSPAHRVDVVAILSKDIIRPKVYNAEMTLMKLYDTQHVLFEFRTQIGSRPTDTWEHWGYVKA